ncbi:MAG: DUF3791 domain-containing protein [Lachnospiraceae bacterium]|nr:DUF3791 domain-containing protein [Lachnospiraceae bacterium]
MPEITRFKAFCLEKYKCTHNLKGNEALSLFNQYGVMSYLDSFYDVLHTYGDNYLVADIDEFIAERRISMPGEKA